MWTVRLLRSGVPVPRGCPVSVRVDIVSGRPPTPEEDPEERSRRDPVSRGSPHTSGDVPRRTPHSRSLPVSPGGSRPSDPSTWSGDVRREKSFNFPPHFCRLKSFILRRSVLSFLGPKNRGRRVVTEFGRTRGRQAGGGSGVWFCGPGHPDGLCTRYPVLPSPTVLYTPDPHSRGRPLRPVDTKCRGRHEPPWPFRPTRPSFMPCRKGLGVKERSVVRARGPRTCRPFKLKC